MDWEIVLKGAGLLVFGLLFVFLGVDGWRQRRAERVSLIEATILKASGEDEPLPFNRFDRMMAYVQPILMLTFGPLMIVGGLAILSMLGE
ncbi:MAG: hypothetical protein ABJN35_07280 [Erythrobacter sp.]